MGTAASHCHLTKSKNNKNPQQLTLRHPVVVHTSLALFGCCCGVSICPRWRSKLCLGSDSKFDLCEGGPRLFKSCPLMTFWLPKGMIRNDRHSYLISPSLLVISVRYHSIFFVRVEHETTRKF